MSVTSIFEYILLLKIFFYSFINITIIDRIIKKMALTVYNDFYQDYDLYPLCECINNKIKLKLLLYK